ncbi:MAG: GNAT family N-acetyltransferase [Clostridia bacterium]
MNNNVSFRYAKTGDEEKILTFVRALAEYEHMEDEVIATPDILNEWLFVKKTAEVIFLIFNDKEVGFALFFQNFSTFLGRGGIYLEDLFVLTEYRGMGFGKAILRKLAEITVERGCGRLEWVCLDWNKPSIDFYLSLSAKPLDEWTIYRLTGETLISFAKS